MEPMNIAVGCDHAGFEVKEALKKYLTDKGMILSDFGTHSTDSVDYPDYVHPLADSVESGKNQLGILVCGSGNGVAMAANKHHGIRAALCWSDEIAKLARQHNDANILCIPARYMRLDDIIDMAATFMETSFEGGRHQVRVNKISLDC